MEKMDYEQLGLRCGIEIHQQLSTHRLFCSCPSKIRDDKPDIVIKRFLRASAGETGEVDVAAEMEQAKGKYYFYHAYNDCNCLVELDEEPPHPLNREALDIAITMGRLLNAHIVDYVQVMRKTVIDGSNVSGFQRTALIAYDGFIDTSLGRVRIPLICLEEEAAKIVERKPDYDVYNLSRLGIPLIEIGTAADIKTPEHAKEVASRLGMILRSTNRVMRGLGTIRQDINISIKNGSRVEIKGAQELKLIPLLVDMECLRQKRLIEIKDDINRRKASAGKKIYELTNLFMETCSSIIKKIISNNGVVSGIKLNSFAGLLKTELQPNRRFGTELSDYAKAWAGVGGIFHSDELPAYGITDNEVSAIKSLMKCNSGNDAFVIVAEQKGKAERALQAVTERIKTSAQGIPSEVRKANEDGTTEFLRPIPGSARMYPETDVKGIQVTQDMLKFELPELITDRRKKLESEYGLSREISHTLTDSGWLDFFESCVRKFTKIRPVFIAETLVNAAKEIKKRFNLDLALTETGMEKIFENVNNGKIPEDAVFEILVEWAKGRPVEMERFARLDEKELKEEIKSIVEANRGLPLNAVIGKVMEKLRGRADGRRIVEIVREMFENQNL